MSEFVRQERASPVAKLADVIARIRRRGPERDHGAVQERPRGAVRGLVRIVDDDVGLARRDVANELAHRCLNRIRAAGERARPVFQLERVMKDEVVGFDRPPRQP